jgi:hypothetical protein
MSAGDNSFCLVFSYTKNAKTFFVRKFVETIQPKISKLRIEIEEEVASGEVDTKAIIHDVIDLGKVS